MAAHTNPKTHTWTLVLLFWVIALLLFVAGYLVYRDHGTPVADVTTGGAETSCDEAITDALAAAADEIACEVVVTTDAYTGSIGPHFTYPIDWEVVVDQVDLSPVINVLHVSEDPLWLCDGCDGPANPIDVTIAENVTADTLDTYVTRRYTAANGYTDITKGTIPIKGVSVLHVKGRFEGIWSGAFEEIVYVTDATIVIASGNITDDSAQAAWEVIKNSLDFSEVE